MRGLRGALAGACAMALCLVAAPVAGAANYQQTGTMSGSTLYVPVGLDVDQGSGDLYVAGALGAGGLHRFAGGVDTLVAPLDNTLLALAIDQSSDIIYTTNNLFKFRGTDFSGNEAITPFGGRGSQSPGLAVTPAGNLIAADAGTGGASKALFEYDPTIVDPADSPLQVITCAACPDTASFGSPKGIAVDSDGNIYVADAGAVVNERQGLTIEATEGTYELSFEGQSTGAEGTGDLTENSATIENVNTSAGAFVIGEEISGTGIPAGTKITGIPEAGKLELSAEATETTAGVSLSADLPYNAGSSVLGAALQALPAIGAGNVAISDGGIGSGLFTIEFKEALGESDQPLLLADSSGLNGGEAEVTAFGSGGTVPARVIKFGPAGDAGPAPVVIPVTGPSGLAINPANDHLFVLDTDVDGRHILEFDEAGNQVSDFGRAELSITMAIPPSDLAVNETTGAVYTGLVKAIAAGENQIFEFTPVAAPAATTGTATSVTGNTATLNASVNPNGADTDSCQLQYTDDADFQANGFDNAQEAECEPNPGNASSPTAVSADVTGLQAQTDYQFRVVLQTPGGTAEGDPEEFTTLVAKAKVSTEAASGISQTSATLNAKVDAEGDDADCSFEYGTTIAYGKTIDCSIDPVTGTASTAVSAALTGLSAGTTYHYRVVATNGGGKAEGTNKTFSTAAHTCQTNPALCPPPQPPKTCQTDASLCPPPPPPTCATNASLCPKPKPLKCKKGFKKKTVKGKQKCVKIKKKKKKK